MLKADLTVPDRIALLGILPQSGSVLTLRAMVDVRLALSFSEAELSHLSLTQTHDRVSWHEPEPASPYSKTVEFGDYTIGLIRAALQHLNDTNSLKPEHLRLWEMFVEG